MMELTTLKKTGTYADTLEVIGTASLLEELGFQGVVIRDRGTEFLLYTRNELAASALRHPGPGYPYIWEQSKEKIKPQFQWLVDYEDGKVKSEAWKKFQQLQKKAKGRIKTALDIQAIEMPPQPPKEYKTAAILASMRKGWEGDRELANWLRGHPGEAMNWIQCRLGLGEAVSEAPTINNTQILNPIAGKGITAAKTEWRSPGALPVALIDSFAEWMKLRGMWTGMVLFRAGDDFKFFCLEPASVTIGGLSAVRKALDALHLWGGVRLDIEAALRCTEILVRHSDVMQPNRDAKIGLRRLTPRSVIAGLRQAYFKSLGTAPALMNDAMLPLPDWFTVERKEDAEAYLSIIDEIIGSVQGDTRTAGCLGSLDEGNSDDGRTFQQFRRWLLTGQLQDFLEFNYQFALHLVRRLSKNQWARPFSLAILSVLFVKSYAERIPMLEEIIEDRGFRSISRAIRNSTIYAIRLKNREIKFGLAQRLKQKIKAGEKEFVTELGEFIQDHNWEVVGRLNGKGHTVATTDLDAVLRLVEHHGAELVGSLLLAYGYAQAPKTEDEPRRDLPEAMRS